MWEKYVEKILKNIYNVILIYIRDNDQELIDVDDAMCQNIMRTAEQLIYVEPPGGGSPDQYGTEASTPDHGTTSEPDVPLSHLAEQESSAFSDDNIRSMTPDSLPGSDRMPRQITPVSLPGSDRMPRQITPVSLPGQITPVVPDTVAVETGAVMAPPDEDDDEDSDYEQVGSRVVYTENEADNSCILQIEEEEEDDHEDEMLDDEEEAEISDVRLKLVTTPKNGSDVSDDDEEAIADFDDAEDFSEGINRMFARMLSSQSGSSKHDTF